MNDVGGITGDCGAGIQDAVVTAVQSALCVGSAGVNDVSGDIRIITHCPGAFRQQRRAEVSGGNIGLAVVYSQHGLRVTASFNGLTNLNTEVCEDRRGVQIAGG